MLRPDAKGRRVLKVRITGYVVASDLSGTVLLGKSLQLPKAFATKEREKGDFYKATQEN